MSEAKSLRWSYWLCFPFALVAIWMVIAIFAHVGQGQLVSVLDERVSHGSVKEARGALDQMARLAEPPLEKLVAAAVSPSRKVARHAQDTLSDLLAKWQSQLIAKKASPARVAARLEILAAALDAQSEAFADSDHAWLSKTTEKILRIAGQSPPDDVLGLAVHCESLLRTAKVYSADQPTLVRVANEAAAAPESIFAPPARWALETLAPAEPAAKPTIPAPAITPLPPAFMPPAPDEVSEQPALPMPRPLASEPMPPAAAPSTAQSLGAAPPAATRTAADPWAIVSSRELLENWLAAKGAKKTQLERELARRGFGTIRSDMARLAVTGTTAQRVALVRDLPQTAGIGTSAWLVLFAEDQDAEVRLAAVTIMATSSDRRLLETAWQIALHDTDPRVADLTTRLRSRRELAARR